MLGSIFLFELRYQLKQPLFWVAFFVLGLMTFGAVTSDGVTLGGGIGAVYRNAPIVILTLTGFMTILGGLFFGTAFVATSVYRDFEYNIHHLFFSKPIHKFDYLVGRFSGSLLISILVLLGPMLGILLGSFMPWLDPERLGPFQISPYLFAFLAFVVPNMIFLGAVFSRSRPSAGACCSPISAWWPSSCSTSSRPTCWGTSRTRPLPPSSTRSASPRCSWRRATGP